MKGCTFRPSIHIVTLYVLDAAHCLCSLCSLSSLSQSVSDPVLGPGSMLALSPDLWHSSQSHNISQPRSLPPTDTDTHFSRSQEAKLGPWFCLSSSRQKIDRLKGEMFVHGQIIMLTIVSAPAAYAGHSTGLPGRHQTAGSCPAPATGGHCPHMPPGHCIVNIW